MKILSADNGYGVRAELVIEWTVGISRPTEGASVFGMLSFPEGGNEGLRKVSLGRVTVDADGNIDVSALTNGQWKFRLPV